MGTEKTLIVISGGPSAGKTTVIEALENLDFPVLYEIGTDLIREGNISPQRERDAFQKEYLRRQLEAEAKLLSLNKLCFLDRGLLDGMAYYVLDGMKIPVEFDKLDVSHYALMFLLEQLPVWVDNGVRYEEPEIAKLIAPMIEEHYKARGVPVIHVPVMPVDERVEFILAHARKCCGKKMR
jgi:predicted ATPase